MENNIFSQDDFSDKQPQGLDPTLLTSDSTLPIGEPTIEIVATPSLPVGGQNAAPWPASPALFAPSRRGGRRHLLALFIALSIMLLLLLGSGGYALARSNLPASSAMLNITPIHQQFHHTYFVTATPDSTDVTLNPIGARRINSTTLNSIEARHISYTTPAASVTVPATGINHHDATYATGTVTVFVFADGLAAGVYTVTDKNGVAIAFYLSSPPAFRTNTDAPAQAVNAGSAGNIPANDLQGIYQTLPPGTEFSLFQTTPFTGGSDASDTTVVAQADIDSATSQVTNQLQSTLAADQAQLKSQLGAGEQLLGGDQGITCQPSLNADQNVNDQSSQVTVTGTMTCSAQAYNSDKLQSGRAADQAQLKSQLSAGEQLLGGDQGIACQPSLNADQNVNDQASRVTSTMTCSALVYSSDKLQTYATNQLTADAARLLGSGYTLTGQAQAKIYNPSDQGKTISFGVDVSGRFFYQLSPAVQAHLLSLIVGKTQAEAQSILLQQPGIAAVSFTVSGGLGTALPGDVKALRVRIAGK